LYIFLVEVALECCSQEAEKKLEKPIETRISQIGDAEIENDPNSRNSEAEVSFCDLNLQMLCPVQI
jgi:hypothetical protein